MRTPQNCSALQIPDAGKPVKDIGSMVLRSLFRAYGLKTLRERRTQNLEADQFRQCFHAPQRSASLERTVVKIDNLFWL